MPETAPHWRRASALARPEDLIAAAGVLAIGLLLLATFVTARTFERIQVWDRAIGHVEARTSQSHVWLEEWLSGDESVDVRREVLATLDEAFATCRALRDGGETPTSSRAVEPIGASGARRPTAALCDTLAALRRLTDRRLANKTSAQAGTTLDSRYDATFQRAIALNAATAAEIEREIAHRRRLVDRVVWSIVAVLLLSFAVTAAISRRQVAHRVEREALRRRAADREHEALHDPLTGLPNRRMFQQRLEEALAAGRATGAPLAVLLADLDHFKELNDTLGHHAGDRLLQELGPRMEDVVRGAETLARLGGDEFALIIPPGSHEETPAEVAERLRRAIARPFAVEGLSLSVEASVGLALFPDHGEDAATLLQRADVAMYMAKRARTGVEVYSAARDHHSRDRLSLVGELQRGIDREELVVHFQPKGDLPTGAVHGAEALLRWQHPERGLLGPDEFIPLAEQTGLMGPITLHVVERSLRQVADWARDGIDLTVAVNLAAPNLLDATLPDRIADLLVRCGVAPAKLKLEITENVIMTDPGRVMDVIARLGELGISLSLDDFGTGYSSLSYLKRLPVDELKIDKSFVMGLQKDSQDAAIVRSTIDLAHSLGLRVVAEGVESADAWDRLTAFGCEEAQGFFLARPMPADQLADWLAMRAAPPKRVRVA